MTNEPLTQKRKNEIRQAAIQRAVQAHDKGKPEWVERMNEYQKAVNAATTYYQLGLAALVLFEYSDRG
jgi:hypothetical protein